MPFEIPLADPCYGCIGIAGNDPETPWVEIRLPFPTVVAHITNRQRSPGSTVVMPRRHVATLSLLEDREAEELFLTIQWIAAAVEDALRPDGFHTWTSSGRLAGQSMGHMHTHLVPRYREKSYTFVPSDTLPLLSLEEKQRQAQSIQQRLNLRTRTMRGAASSVASATSDRT